MSRGREEGVSLWDKEHLVLWRDILVEHEHSGDKSSLIMDLVKTLDAF